MEEKVMKVGDTITKLQNQVEELQFNIKLDNPQEERERRGNFNEESSTLQELRIIEPKCARCYKVSLMVYEKLLIALEMQEANKKVQECDKRSAQLRSSLMKLCPAMYKN